MNRATLNAFHEERDKLVEERDRAVNESDLLRARYAELSWLKTDLQKAWQDLDEIQAANFKLQREITEWRRKYADEVQKRFELLELLQRIKGENDAKETT